MRGEKKKGEGKDGEKKKKEGRATTPFFFSLHARSGGAGMRNPGRKSH